MKKNLLNVISHVVFVLAVLYCSRGHAQPLTGIKTIPGTYPSLSAAILDLNTKSVGSGGVTFNINAGYTETISAPLSIKTSGTSANPIVFQKSGSGVNPKIIAYTGGTGTPATAVQDGIWNLVGADYVIIDGIDLAENPANTSNPATMEYGYGLFKANLSDGCKNNTIKNCVVTLNRNNSATAAGPAFDGSCGIVMLNSTPNNATTSLTILALNGTSSNNSFYANTIQNCNNGIVLSGFAARAPYTITDKNNDIGGNGTSTGNTFINFGGGTTATTASAAVVIKDQWDFNVSYNTINNNNGSGVNHVNTLRGIWTTASSNGASGKMNNNTITLSSSGITASLIAIENNAGSKAASPNTISISNNTITNCSYTNATSGLFYGIYNLSTISNIVIRGNTFSNNTTAATSGSFCFIFNANAIMQSAMISNNVMTNTTFTATSTSLVFRAIQVTFLTNYLTTAASLTIDTNTLQQINYTGTGENSAIYVSNVTAREVNMRKNNIASNTFNTTGAFYAFYANSSFSPYPSLNSPSLYYGTKNILNNVVNNITRSMVSGMTYGTFCNNTDMAKGNVITIANNQFTNITCGGSSGMTIIQEQDGGTTLPYGPQKLIYNNTISNITSGSGTSTMMSITGSDMTRPGQVYNNIMSNITGTGTLIGIVSGNGSGLGAQNYFDNTITGFLTSGYITAMTFQIGPVISNAYGNKIYDLTTTGTNTAINGITTDAGTPMGTPIFGIYNNLIGDLKAPNTSGANMINGLNIGRGAVVNIYHNTIVLNASSTGTDFGTTAVNITATPSNVLLNNNILINTSTPKGTGITAVLRRASNVLTNFSTLSQSNLYYAGAVAFNRAIMFDGTNTDSTLAQYKTRVGPNRDSLAITENVTFLSLSGSNPDFLKPSSAIATAIESGALPVSGLSIAFGNAPRPGNPAYAGSGGLPDLGAIEGNYLSSGSSAAVPMIYDSSSYSQITGSTLKGSTNTQMLRIRVYASNSGNAYVTTSFKFTTTGTTLPANITAAKVYSTAGSSTFSDASLFGSVSSPGSTFYINGARGLSEGVNYFWLVYDVNAAATNGNFLDATLDSIVLNGSNYPLTSADTLGAREVKSRMSGNYDIGVGKLAPHFTSINAALNDLAALGVSGPVTFTLTDATYDIATTNITSFPLNIPAIDGVSASNTVTFRPAAATNVTITGNAATSAIFNLNGADYIIIDGRQDGSGTPKSLTIQNTSASGMAVNFVNDASYNTLKHTVFKGQSSGNNIGVINWSGGLTTGNDYNIVDSCDIGDNGGANTPAIAINSAGSADGSTYKFNDYNSVTNCNIYNFWNAVGESDAFKLNFANNYWTITGNSLYQTSTRSGSSICFTFNFDNQNNWDGLNGLVISGNFIGGSEPKCGGTPWTQTLSAAQLIPYFAVGELVPSRFSNNTMANFSFATTSISIFLSGPTAGGALGFCYLLWGKMDIDSNMFGSLSDPNSIVVSAGNGGIITGILHGMSGSFQGPGAYSIADNKMGGIRLQPPSGMVNSFTGIVLNTTLFSTNYTGVDYILNVRRNVIGGIGPDNIIAMASSGTGNQAVRGISSVGSLATVIIDSNIIQNLTNLNGGTGTGTQVIGISSAGSVNTINTITNNRIDSLYSESPQTGTGLSASVIGISCSSASTSSIIGMNSIYGLKNGATSGAAQVTGIFYNTGTSGLIHRNVVHSLSSISATAIHNGIMYAGGTARVVNNMIRLGIDADGNAVTTTPAIYGINKTGGNLEAYFNNVYIGGDNVGATASNTFAFNRSASGTDAVLNNIFVNNRSNATTGGGHYVIGLNNTATLTLNSNIYHSAGIGANLGMLNGAAIANLATWKAATVSDASTASAIPGFANATGNISSFNLHLVGTNPAEGAGTPVSGYGVETDFDGQTRNELSPVDIGADADNFIPVDLTPPTITYTPLDNTINTGDRTLIATITDATGIYMSGTFRPRIVYKKQGISSYVSSQGVLVSGSKTNSQWSFTILSSMFSGGLSGADSVFYYVVAQDSSSAGNNLGSTPAGVDGTDITNISLDPTSPNSYRIMPFISGTILVGAGETYTSLTGNDGAFRFINSSVVSGDLTLQITSDIRESGNIALEQTVESGIGGYTIRIVPSAAIERVLYTTSTLGMIRLNGADRIIFDGRFNGSGRYLKLVDTSGSGLPAFVMQNDAHRDTLMYCTILGNNTATGDVLFGASTSGSGNDSNAVMYCRLGGINRTTHITNVNISSANATAGMENSENTIAYNDFLLFRNSAIVLNATATGNNWLIYNNTFSLDTTINPTVDHKTISIQGGGGHIIRKNSIGGSRPDRGGSAYRIHLTGTIRNIMMIQNNTTSSLANTIDSNTFGNITYTAATIPTPPTFDYMWCIYNSSSNATTNIIANTVGNLGQPADSVFTSAGNLYGINTGPASIRNNTVANLYNRYVAATITAGIATGNAVMTVSGNTIHDIVSHSTSTTDFASIPTGLALGTSVGGLTVDRNIIYNIKNANLGTAPYLAAGIVYTGAGGVSVISRNRISNISAAGTGTSTSAPQVFGIYTSSTIPHTYHHNQVSIGSDAWGETRVYGMYSAAASGAAGFYYNSVLVSGKTTSGANNSYAIYRSGAAPILTWNNIAYNARTTDGTGSNYASGMANITGISATSSNYNLFVVNDTNKVSEYGTGNAVGAWAFNNTLNATYGTSNSNWIASTTNIPADSLFIDTLTGNLGTRNDRTHSWYVNGKGCPIAGQNGDFNNNASVRSVTIATGSTDIGSMQITPTTQPADATADKAPALNDSTTYYFGARPVLKVKWGTVGTLPSSLSVKYYSGVNPPNTVTGTTYTNAYWNIDPTGGSGYSTSMTLLQDSAILGSVGTRSGLSMVRYAGPGFTWSTPLTTVVNNIAGTMTATGVSSFGIYTGTNALINPLPVELLAFNASSIINDVQLSWSTASEVNNAGFAIERSVNGKNFKEIDFVKSTGKTSGVSNYQRIDQDAFSKNKTNILYYRLRQQDFNGRSFYSSIETVLKTDRKNANYTSVFPNPFNDQLTVKLESKVNEMATIRVFDITGKEMMSVSQQLVAGTNQFMIDGMSALHPGIYFMFIDTTDDKQVMKLVKE